MADYPEHWEADVVLADGGTAHLRPVGRDDTEALRAMHSRMSSRTKYLRYFAAVGAVSDRQLAVYTDVDYVATVGFVVELAGELIAAGTYHRIPGTTAAEVAFVVEDAQQKRGLGSILLEHLAAAARERDITSFSADVLSENASMRRIFADAGYADAREFGDGAGEPSFAIVPTDASRAVMYARERRAEARSIERLLRPTSIAVIGASDEPRDIGHAVIANLLASGYAGPVYPVHPGLSVLHGLSTYRSIRDIPGGADLAVIAVAPSSAAHVVEDCSSSGVHGLVVASAGYAESGSGGATAQRELVAAARAHGMRVLGPNCLGLINTDPAVRMNATFAPVVPAPGSVGIFCQSAALGITLLAAAAQRGLGVSTFASAGNRADVSGNDLLQFWYDDERTEAVLLYLESFGNPRKFARLARALARRKPVIALKSGRHAVVTPGLAEGSAMISDIAVDTVFGQAGVLRVDSVADAFDTARLLTLQPLPAGNRVAIIANSTALGVLALDACLEQGLQVAGDGPIDVGVGVDAATLAFTVRAALYDTDVDALVVVYVPPVGGAGVEHAAALRVAMCNAPVPVASSFLAVEGIAEHLLVRDGTGAVTRGSVPSYPTPERAVAAVARAVRYASWRARPAGELPELENVDSGRARALVDQWRAQDRTVRALHVDSRVELLRCYGISVLDYRVASSADQAVAAAQQLGYPVVIKTTDESFRHRDDRVGVRLQLADADSVRAAFEDLTALVGPQVFVQAMAAREKSTVSTVFGIRADPSFGALIWFGLGGMATELLDDRAYRAVPLTDVDAAELIAGPKAAPLLRGYRGSDPVDVAALQDVALRLSALSDDVPEILELSLRPALAGPAGVVVTGTSAVLGPPPMWREAARRMR